MRVRSEVDLWVKILIWFVVFILVAVIVLTPLDGHDFGAVACLGIIVFLLWMYYGTYYELREDHVYCRSGPFFERIFYDRISYVTLVQNMWSSLALSSKRIEIRQHNKGFFMGTTFISPQNREEFYIQLRGKCKNLDSSLSV